MLIQLFALLVGIGIELLAILRSHHMARQWIAGRDAVLAFLWNHKLLPYWLFHRIIRLWPPDHVLYWMHRICAIGVGILIMLVPLLMTLL